MPYNEKLAERVREILKRRRVVTEKKMFGGLAFMLNGNMCCGVEKENLMVRVGPERYEAALAKPHARPMDFTGRPLTGFVYVGPGAYRTEKSLTRWINLGLSFVASLPKKQARQGHT